MATVEEIDAYVTRNPSYINVHRACQEFKDEIEALDSRPDYHCRSRPDYIVGLSRGGLIPATILSHMTDIPLVPVKYSSKSGNGDNRNHDNVLPHIDGATLLIVDDISDSGNTLREVVDHYRYEGHTVRTAALYYKELANPVFVPDIVWKTIPEDGPWIVFPWEC